MQTGTTARYSAWQRLLAGATIAGFVAFVLLPDVSYSGAFLALPVLVAGISGMFGRGMPKALSLSEGIGAETVAELKRIEARGHFVLWPLILSMGVGMTTRWGQSLWGPYDRIAAVASIVAFVPLMIAGLLLRRRYFAVLDAARPA